MGEDENWAVASSARSSIDSTKGRQGSCGYATTRSHLEMAVAFAITTGVLGRETIPAELLEHLAGALRFYEEEAGDDRVRTRNQRAIATAQVYQFKLALIGVEPPIWRRIQVPETYSFWDLHVALQDAMGWLDYHLHVFRVARPGAVEVEHIGIPDDDPFEGEKPTLPGWEIPISRYFARAGTSVPTSTTSATGGNTS